MDEHFHTAEYLQAILDAMGEKIRVITKEGRVALTNKAYDRKIAGGKKTVGERCYDVFGQANSCDFCVASEVLSTGRAQQSTRRFNNRIYSVATTPLEDGGREPYAVVEVFRDMTLDYNIKQNLLRQNAKMQKDLQLARSLQQALVKNVLPNVPGYELHSGFFPCEAVGGDIFDCLDVGSHLVLYVADVSGHGVMPAMLSVFFQRAVKGACSLGYLRPSEILSFVQQEFLGLQLSDSIYITGFVIVLEKDTGKFRYSNAGLSVVPVLYNSGIHELYMSAPPISSWFDSPTFRDEDAELSIGSRVLVYSDGLHEIHSNDRVKERLYELFAREPFDCGGFVGNVHGELHVKPEDDLTMLICSRCGN